MTPDTGQRLMLPLAAVRGGDRPLAGGKACGLGELLAGGFDVPDGLVLTTEAHRLAAAAVRRAGRDPADPESWELPADLAHVLDAHRLRLGGAVAVRSSAVDEDTPSSAAAGRYLTVLDVRDRAALVTAVQACWASAAQAAQAAQATRAGEDGCMAVLVQRLVTARHTGVAFTADPVTGDRDVVVVVSGAPGDVTAGRHGREWRLSACRDGAAAPARADGKTGKTDPDVPDVPDVAAVAALAQAVAAALGGPVDVEWAADPAQLTVLQARPMTALPDPVRWEAPLPGGWLRNFRFGEWLPGPVTPLFESWFLTRVEDAVIRLAAAEAGLVLRPPLHVTVAGWYFHAPFGTSDPARTILRAAVRRPLVTLASALIGSRPELSERLVVHRFTHAWQVAVRPRYQEAAKRLAAGIDTADPAKLVALVEQTAVAVAEMSWSLSMVGGFAWKAEAALLGLLGQELTAAEGRQVAAALTRTPKTAGPTALAPYAVESLDWIHPTAGQRASGTAGPDPAAGTGPGDAEQTDQYAQATKAARDKLGARRWRRVSRLSDLVTRYTALREEQAELLTLPWPALRRAVHRLGDFLTSDGVIAAPSDIYFLTYDELAAAVARRGRAGDTPPPVNQRRRNWLAQHRLAPPLCLGRLPRIVAALLPPPPDAPAGALVSGQPASVGRATGTVVVAFDLTSAERLAPGQILVAPLITPAWRPVVARAAAVVTDSGTLAAHSALICRELAIPMIVATGDATRRLLDGDLVTVDGATGGVHGRVDPNAGMWGRGDVRRSSGRRGG